jgi:hypothetical protein
MEQRSEPDATACAAHQDAYKRGWLPIWTVYDHPTDYPDRFVARMYVAGPIDGNHGTAATTVVLFGNTLDEVRAMLPPGVVRMDRYPGDDPKIVETWM